MDPNQTTGTAPSRVNDIDPIGPDSGNGVTPTGLTGANDTTETAQTQRIPPIGTSSQDRSPPINQTSIPERAGARNGSTERQGEPRTRIPPPNHSIFENQTPSVTRTFHQAGFNNLTKQARRHDIRGPVNIDPQWEDLGIPSETRKFQNYIERNDAELKRIHAIVHMATSSSPDIDMVIEETRRTPFTNRIASAHVRAFHLVISREQLTDDEKEAGYCRFFTENLTGATLEWFAGLEENSIDNFTQLNGVWFSSKFREELVVRAPISLDDALRRASYFATHEEEVAALKEQYCANKNNATKRPATPKEPTTKGQHSYAINDSPQKSSTYDLSKYCAFHDRKGHSTEECRAALHSQNENKKTTEEAGEEEEEPVTPKSNRKAKVPTNKRGRESEEKSRHDFVGAKQQRNRRNQEPD
uniref:Retrotransposon gag domain-containing protein n=1 Tax=Brassica oleracea var. oleracea TaxID=109376 RepID=A0A0D3CQU6_BRAOL